MATTLKIAHHSLRLLNLKSQNSINNHHSLTKIFIKNSNTISQYPIIKNSISISTNMSTTSIIQEIIPKALDATSDPPSLFDGTTRLYTSLLCPYAQRVWITRNVKGLLDEIKLVPIDVGNRPAWYKEKINPANKVPALEHKNEIKGESLDLIKYIDSNFDGPSLFPNEDEVEKQEFAKELLAYTDTFNGGVVKLCKGEEGSNGAAFDYFETALGKFDDGPFLLGKFSLVDIAYAPFIERFVPFLLEVKNYDSTQGRPKLGTWIDEMNKIEGYNQTKRDPAELLAIHKKVFGAA